MNGILAQRKGNAWDEKKITSGSRFVAIWGNSTATAVFASLDRSTDIDKVYRDTGDNSWGTPYSWGSRMPALGLWGFAASDVWAVGDGGMIAHFDGTTWTPKSGWASGAIDPPSLNDVWVSEAGEVFAAGGSTIWAFEKGQLVQIQGLQVDHIEAIWGRLSGSELHLFVAGTNGFPTHGEIHRGRRNSAGTWVWDPPHVDGTITPTDLWGDSTTNVYLTTGECDILHYGGSTWAPATGYNKPPATACYGLNAVWGSGAKDIFAVGDDEIIVHYDGGWNIKPAHFAGVHLKAVWGDGKGTVFAGGAEAIGRTLRYTAATGWNPVPGNGPGAVVDLWGHHDSQGALVVYASTSSAVFRSTDNGDSWAQVNLAGITNVAALAGNNHWLYGVGTNGGIVFVDLR